LLKLLLLRKYLLQLQKLLQLRLRRQVPKVERASLALVDHLQHRVHLVLRSISLQRHAQRPPLDVPRCLQACHQPECLLVRVPLLVAHQSHHLLVLCRPQVSAFRHLLVSAWLLVRLVLVQAVSVLVLVDALVVPEFVRVLVAHAPVVLADSVLVLVAPAVLVRVALVVLAVRVDVLVLVLVLAALVVHVLVVLVAHRVQAVLVAVLVPAAVLAAPAVHAMVNVVHLARSHVRVAGVSSMNCSRSSRSTQTAMLPFLKARSSSSVVGLLRSSLRS
jgi:hypothetical protein